MELIIECFRCHRETSCVFCSDCKKVPYCGYKCQKLDWERHQSMCGKEGYKIRYINTFQELLEEIEKFNGLDSPQTFFDLAKRNDIKNPRNNGKPYEKKELEELGYLYKINEYETRFRRILDLNRQEKSKYYNVYLLGITLEAARAMKMAIYQGMIDYENPDTGNPITLPEIDKLVANWEKAQEDYNKISGVEIFKDLKRIKR